VGGAAASWPSGFLLTSAILLCCACCIKGVGVSAAVARAQDKEQRLEDRMYGMSVSRRGLCVESRKLWLILLGTLSSLQFAQLAY